MNNNNNNNNNHHLARAVGGIAAVPANSSFRHSTYDIKRHSVPPRLALPRNQTTTTTNVIIHNFHTDFFFPLHYAVPATKTALISSAYISWTKAPRADSKTSFCTQIHAEDCPPSSLCARMRTEVFMANMGI
jgi:hypothetical protein